MKSHSLTPKEEMVRETLQGIDRHISSPFWDYHEPEFQHFPLFKIHLQ